MKSHKPSKLIALGLALTMGLSIPAALAASSLVPASTKVTVDGKAAAVEGYNIDNGNNYYTLRDVARALDAGLTWIRPPTPRPSTPAPTTSPTPPSSSPATGPPLPAPASRP